MKRTKTVEEKIASVERLHMNTKTSELIIMDSGTEFHILDYIYSQDNPRNKMRARSPMGIIRKSAKLIYGFGSRNEEPTRRYTRSAVNRDACESPAGHCDVLTAHKHPTAKPGLGGADETDSHSSRE
jgi:hypothetical protein